MPNHFAHSETQTFDTNDQFTLTLPLPYQNNTYNNI